MLMRYLDDDFGYKTFAICPIRRYRSETHLSPSVTAKPAKLTPVIFSSALLFIRKRQRNVIKEKRGSDVSALWDSR